MEIRSYEELQLLIEEFYKTYSNSQLKYFDKNKNVYRPRLILPYCSEKPDFAHILEIIIPGKKTFQTSKKTYSDTKQSNDIKIILKRNDEERVITHKEIIEDLYHKAAAYTDENSRRCFYTTLRSLLTYLYSSDRLTDICWETWIFNNNYIVVNGALQYIPGEKIPTLVSFIRWCAVQEMINYPRGWGKDLCFARYFEAIYAGFLGNMDMLNNVIERAESRKAPQPLDSIVELSNSTYTLMQYGIDGDIYNDITELQERR